MATTKIPQLVKPIEPVANISSEVKSGQGFTFEDYVAAVYLSGLLTETTATGLSGRVVTRVEIQQGAFGRPLDDLAVTAQGADGIDMMFDVQLKQHMTISAAKSNADFRETVLRAYQTILKTGFKLNVDRVGAIVGDISDEPRREFWALCEMARDESDASKFVEKLRTPGTAGNKLTQFDAVQAILEPHIESRELDLATHQLLAHFVLSRMEMLAEGSVIEAQTIALLANALSPDERSRALDLWKHLLSLVRPAQGRSGGLDRPRLVANLRGAFRLDAAPSLSAAVYAIQAEATLACAEIPNEIAGVTIPRTLLAQQVLDHCIAGQFLQITGVPGAGKSVVLRTAVELALKRGPALFLKADRLTGNSWSQFATAMSIGPANLEALLVELAACGSSTLFIDGIDRVAVSERKVLVDIFNTISSSELLAGWSVAVTVRDTGLEPIRTWLPDAIVSRGLSSVQVSEFNQEEATQLAEAIPALAASLNGSEPMRSLVRRPFFASVLAREARQSATLPTSEIGLAELWWQRGGYVDDAAAKGHRRLALVRLAQDGAEKLGRRISVEHVDPTVLEALVADGVVRWVKVGHRVQFVHDIFFEWSFLQHLVGKDGDWQSAVHEAGQPPALGRVVELLSQSTLTEGDVWASHLERLENDPSLRSQWRRSWLVGPFSLPTFDQHVGNFEACVFAAPAERLNKLLVWYQAEKTEPNRLLLNGSDTDVAAKVRLADRFGIPGDFRDWRRFADWILDNMGRFFGLQLQDAFAALTVWQNFFADFPNPLSRRIVNQAATLQQELEDLQARTDYSDDWGRWTGLSSDERERSATDLCSIVLRGARPLPDFAKAYLLRLEQRRRNRADTAVEQVFNFAKVLADACPAELANFTIAVTKDRLPEEAREHAKRSGRSQYYSIGEWDWSRLGMEDIGGRSTASPGREPFASLFEAAPDEARRVVRTLSNHATTAWRQLNKLSRERGRTPIPLELTFPWGKQTFWGSAQQYQWTEGPWAPEVVGSGLAAMAVWALKRTKDKADADEVIQQVLEGQDSIAAVAIACLVALQAQAISPATAPLISSQRIWRWDIRRSARTITGMRENLMGFNEWERDELKAVQAMNAATAKLGDIRNLAILSTLVKGPVAESVWEAVLRFESDLPFDFEEERSDTGFVASLTRNAQIWAEFGREENFRASQSPDGKGVIITVDNPKAVGPDIDAINARTSAIAKTAPLQTWTYDYFEHGRVPESLTLAQAVEAAKKMDSPDLFEVGYPNVDPMHAQQGCVGGVAAAALLLQSEEDLDWAQDVCCRAINTPEGDNEFFIPTSLLFNHPVQRGVQGLGALLNLVGDDEARDLEAILTEFAAHPYVRIGTEAVRGMLKAWGTHPQVAANGIRLSVELSIIKVRGELLDGDETDRERVVRVVETALARLKNETRDEAAQEPLPQLPPHWIQAAQAKAVCGEDGSSDEGTEDKEDGEEGSGDWMQNPLQVYANHLKDILPAIPVLAATSDPAWRERFLDWCESLVRWSMDRLNPVWATDRQLRAIRKSPRVSDYEWDIQLCRLIANVTLQLDVAESDRRFLNVITQTDDETFNSYGETYLSTLVCAIADAPSVSPVALELAKRIVERLIRDGDWNNEGRYRRGRTERAVQEMVKDAFFSDFKHAALAMRFANDRWEDVAIVIPVFQPLLIAHGTSAPVTLAWLSLCERSFDHYPAQHFSENLKHLFRTDGKKPGWSVTSAAARLAALIQRFSERTQPLPTEMAQACLRALDELVDLGDRRAAAVQTSEVFRSIRRA